jgi:hypothetical protein
LYCSSTSSLSSSTSMNPTLASPSSIVSSDGKRKLTQTQVIPHSHSPCFFDL